MKIKTVKKLNLPELIQHVWENDIESTGFLSNEELPNGKNLRVHVNPRDVAGGRCAGISVESGDFVVHDMYTFTVEAEEELTEGTVLDELVFVYDDYKHRPLSGSMVHKSIQNVLEYKTPIYKIYTLVDRSLVLIWSAETGIPESGVLEVDEGWDTKLN